MATWRNSSRIVPAIALAFAVTILCPAAISEEAKANTCLDCHSALDAPLQVNEASFAHDVHAQKGLGCADCHGGDPASMDHAMSPRAGFRGKIKRSDVPRLCARCHSDENYIRRYNPSLRTDQLSQYLTSVHGKKLTAGDDHVAVCTDCHQVHNIRPAKDPASSVHPLNVANTCKRCHADAAYMQRYKIATDQFSGYSASVHHAALAQRGDLSAPTCVTCHGNHGAAPPGVAAVANVCSTCHVFQAQLFAASPHKAAFESAGMPACVTCHSNHRIQHPSDSMLGVGPESVCTNCHVDGDAGYKSAQALHDGIGALASAITRADDMLDRAERSGMEVSQPKLEQAQARDALTKARVNIHAFRAEGIRADVDSGTKLAASHLKAGEAALAEREYRRKGLGFSVIAIFAVLAGLWLFLREIEARPPQE